MSKAKPAPAEERCHHEVHSGWRRHQCYSHGALLEDGQRWCRLHAPSIRDAKQKARHQRWMAKAKAATAPFEELARLHAQNAKLLEMLEGMVAWLDTHPAGLHPAAIPQNAKLLEMLEGMVAWLDTHPAGLHPAAIPQYTQAIAAIAEHLKEEKP